MFTVIAIMFAGVALGYLLRSMPVLRKLGRPVSYTIYALLFFLGFSVGGNSEIINNLPSLGGQALILSIAGTLGSVLAAWLVYRFFFKNNY